MRTLKVAFVLLALSLCCASRANAKDMCFYDDYASILVGQGFSFPAAGRCKAFNGYQNGNGSGCLISGEACGTSDYQRVKFNLTYTCTSPGLFGTFGTYAFDIDRVYSDVPQSGLGFAYQGGTHTQFHVYQIPCPDPHPLNH